MRKWHINLPDQDLAYFPEGTDHFDDYVEAVEWAQDFARLNRAGDDDARDRRAAVADRQALRGSSARR